MVTCIEVNSLWALCRCFVSSKTGRACSFCVADSGSGWRNHRTKSAWTIEYKIDAKWRTRLESEQSSVNPYAVTLHCLIQAYLTLLEITLSFTSSSLLQYSVVFVEVLFAEPLCWFNVSHSSHSLVAPPLRDRTISCRWQLTPSHTKHDATFVLLSFMHAVAHS